MFTKKFTRQLSLMLSGALLLVLCATPNTFAQSQDKKTLERAAKVKTEIAKLGTGKDARIAIKLRDKTQVAGYVSQVGEDSFVIADLNTNAATTVAYREVVQARGKGLSTGAKIAIGVGIGVGLFFLIATLGYVYDETH